MRNYNGSSESLFTSMKSQFNDIFRGYEMKENSQHKSSPCKPDPLEMKRLENMSFGSQKYRVIHGYLILLHCVDDEYLKWFIRLDLEEHLECNPEFFWMSVLTDRQLYLKWLLETERLSSSDFFGNLLTKKHLIPCWETIVFRFAKSIDPIRPIRRRGYKDKGTRLDISSSARQKLFRESDYLQREQLLTEVKREFQRENRSLLKNYLEGVGSLNDAQLCYFRLKKGEIEYGRKEITYPGREVLLERERNYELRIKNQRRRRSAAETGNESQKLRLSDQESETVHRK